MIDMLHPRVKMLGWKSLAGKYLDEEHKLVHVCGFLIEQIRFILSSEAGEQSILQVFCE